MPEVTDIIAANGDVWRVERHKLSGGVFVYVAHPLPGELRAEFNRPCDTFYIPAEILPRVVEALKGLVKA